MKSKFLNVFLFIILSAAAAFPQTTEFTYQGKLTEGAMSPTANYDFEFRLYDAAAGETLLGTQTRPSVPISNSVFTVRLDFGAQFSGAARYLEISVKPAGSANPLTPLAPRQPVTSAPYAVRSLNAATATNSLQLGGTAANQFVQTTDGRLNDARQPSAGSFDYVQNRTTAQAATNFNISGNGTAGGTLTGSIVRADTQFNIGNSRILSNAGANNLFAGRDAGTSNTGLQNSFFGHSAGNANTSGDQNAFFGSFAGDANTTGDFNSFFGSVAGNKNTTADHNSFFGYLAGRDNTSGSRNSFFGNFAGRSNSTGTNNVYVGNGAGMYAAGSENVIVGSIDTAYLYNRGGSGNVIIGYNAKHFGTADNPSGSNVIIGTDAKVAAGCLSCMAIGAGAEAANGRFRSVAIGPDAMATQDNQIALGNEYSQVYIRGNLTVDGTITENFAGKNSLSESVAKQQTEIEAQAKQIEEQKQIINRQTEQFKQQEIRFQKQQAEIEALKTFLCAQNPSAAICSVKVKKEENK